MSRKFIEKEGPRWTKLGIVTPAQYEQILHLYSEKQRAVGLVPILGSILVGLGILSFVAANWQEIPQLLRLSIIVVAMIGFYLTGEMFLKRAHEKLGVAFIGIGLVTFGAGTVLIAQMFHLEAYQLSFWLAWGLAGVLLTYLYGSRYLFLMSTLILTIAQFYSSAEFNHFSYLAFIVLFGGLGYYVWRNRDVLLVWFLSISFIAQSIMLINVHEWKFVWVFVPALFLYTLGDWLKDRSYFYPLQWAPLMFAYLFDLFIVIFWGNEFTNVSKYDDLLGDPAYFLSAMVVLFGLSLAFKLRSNRAISGFEWILMPPLLYLPIMIDITYLIVLFLFSLFMLWRGYVEERRFKINLGTLLFLVATMTAYAKLTWDFMDKSLFFIIGGVLLLALSWFLNYRRKQFLEDAKEGDNRD